jgi:hypothetical protein
MPDVSCPIESIGGDLKMSDLLCPNGHWNPSGESGQTPACVRSQAGLHVPTGYSLFNIAHYSIII